MAFKKQYQSDMYLYFSMNNLSYFVCVTFVIISFTEREEALIMRAMSMQA